MPAIVATTLNGISGADHVFAPWGFNGNVATWFKPGASPIADEKMTHSLVRLPSGKQKMVLKLELPKSEDVDGKTVITRRGYITLEMIADPTHTAAERGEMLDLIRSALNATDAPGISASWADLQPYF